MLPEDIQSDVLSAHGDLFRRLESGMVTTRIEFGTSAVSSVVDAPFGVGFPFDPSRFAPLDKWSFE
jgi:hypothetical protein